ncbi:hypothetical protein ABIA10_006411 [Rhizobium leguminosarum]
MVKELAEPTLGETESVPWRDVVVADANPPRGIECDLGFLTAT